MTRLIVALMLANLSLAPASAVSLAEYAKANTIKLFIPKKGAVMPNSIDAPGHLQLGTKALLLSGLGLSNLDGISKLIVDDEGEMVPVTSVKHLHLYVNSNGFTTLPDEIGALDNVEFLYCEDNRLSTLPRALADMEIRTVKVAGEGDELTTGYAVKITRSRNERLGNGDFR